MNAVITHTKKDFPQNQGFPSFPPSLVWVFCWSFIILTFMLSLHALLFLPFLRFFVDLFWLAACGGLTVLFPWSCLGPFPPFTCMRRK